MTFDPGIDIQPVTEPLGIRYGHGVFGPPCELRMLDAIRPSLRDPQCKGPDPVYAIAMDVGTEDRRTDLIERNLLFGVVTFAAGQLGEEPVRSQGHVHAISKSCGVSTAELYEIWSGSAVILMQESDGDHPGRSFAVTAEVGEVVVVPPGWAHATISADPSQSLTFGAWCVRDFGFDYQGVRTHKGLAWFPLLKGDILHWEANTNYPIHSTLIEKGPEVYAELGLKMGISIWRQYLQNPENFMWIPQPAHALANWEGFIP